MQIRLSNPADRERLFDIWHRAVLATHDFVTAEDREEIADAVKNLYLPNAALWVACDENGRALAFMGMSDAHVDALFVDPVEHRRGVGRALMDHALALHSRLTVDVNEQNGAALAFYQRLGFRCTARSDTDEQGRPYPILHLQNF